MSLSNTPSAERIHIGIFGKRNAGKSSLINALTGQNLAIVSDVKGTTTDPVLKSMELLPLGPVVLIDTPGLDDTGELGGLRIQKAYQTLNKTDIAILVMDISVGMTEEDRKILKRIKDKKIPYVIVWNKVDLLSEQDAAKFVANGKTALTDPDICTVPIVVKYPESDSTGYNEKENKKHLENAICISTKTGENIYELKELIARQIPSPENNRRIVADLILPKDFVVLVVPIDSSAPKGRLILPQQQTIRDILDAGAVSIVVKDTDLQETLQKLGALTKLVITDSQVFKQVSVIVPPEIPLTSFSILFARYKGSLDTVAHGAKTLDELKDGDTVLISEGCTHHRQCDDIGTVKLPNMIRKYTGKEIHFEFTSGTEFPNNLSPYRMIIHCGGCMLNEREMKYRLKCAEDAGIPITNYGTAIAHMQGILERSLEVFR